MVRYRVEVADLNAHLLRVTLTLPAPAPDQELMLPVWIPGSYLVREFSRHLSQLLASQGGKPVALTQLDKHRWRAACSGRAALVLSWQVYAFDASVRTAWLDARRGFFNPASVLLSAVGREADEHRVTLAGLPTGWQVATGLPQVGQLEYAAPDYDALIDHPFELGDFWRASFEAGGVTHEFVVAGALPGFDGARLLADTHKICAAQIAFWHGEHGRPPFDRYVFMLWAVDDGYGGLEHRNSTALIAKRADLPRVGMNGSPDGYVTLLGLISHEYFHTWNVKRLKPAEFAPYDLTRENYSELLWFFEGFTSYYDDVFLLRTGLIDAARYLKLVAKTATQVLATPGRKQHSLAEASFDAWIKYYRPDENTLNATVSYYTKGALLALALDLTLRREGERRRGDVDARPSLDTLMRQLWAGSGADAGVGPITEQDIARVLQAVGARSYAPELAAWVHGTDDLPLAELLAHFGVRWSHDTPTLVQRLGLRLQDTPQGVKVQALQRGGRAEAAGMAAGDELLALADWRISRIEDLVLLAAALPRQPGGLALLVARDRLLLTLRLDVGVLDAGPPGSRNTARQAARRQAQPDALTALADTSAGTVQLALDSAASAAQVRRRDAWLSRA
jgi:predicted metalloprotease with PDZ domain